MVVVSNITPIISLCSICQVELLKKLFGKVIVSKAVYQEIKAITQQMHHYRIC